MPNSTLCVLRVSVVLILPDPYFAGVLLVLPWWLAYNPPLVCRARLNVVVGTKNVRDKRTITTFQAQFACMGVPLLDLRINLSESGVSCLNP